MDRSSLPYFWELLSTDDQEMYSKISNALGAPTLKNKRNTKINDFSDALEAIEIYQNHDKSDKWRRCLVSGLVLFDGGIAVNIKQFRKLVRKCKTSINTSLKGMGYTIISGKATECEELLEAIPCLRGNTAELRQWTVRYKEEDSNNEPENDQYVTPPSVAFDEKYGDNGATIAIGPNDNYAPQIAVDKHLTANDNTKQIVNDNAGFVDNSFDDYDFEQFIQWDDAKFSDSQFTDTTF